MKYKDRLLEEFVELIIKRTRLVESEFIKHDELLQKQAEAMFNYEQILGKRILKIMHESDCRENITTNMRGVNCCEQISISRPSDQRCRI